MASISILLDWLDTTIEQAELDLRLQRGRYELLGTTDVPTPGRGETNDAAAPARPGTRSRRPRLRVAH
jgi:hypothetical protein